MANILIVHEQIPVRAALLGYVQLRGHRGFEASDLNQARMRLGSTPCSVVVVGASDGERDEPNMRDIRHNWPMAEVAVLRSTADLFDVFDAIGSASAPERRAESEITGEPIPEALRHGQRRSIDPSGEPIAVDPITRAVFAKAARAAAVNSAVLISGSSGTGKEVLARYVHRHSMRRNCKFIPVNCGCLTETLIEAELFGYRKGAFTGALSDRKGLIEEAEGGVLFLDEIGEMPMSLQVRLLRFLDSGEVRPVGETHVRHADVRVIAASNKDLLSAVRQNRFRDDLYFRLSVVALELPPLCERRGDIRALVNHCMCRAAAKLGLGISTVTEEAMSLLVQYDWPGNIRELQNTVEQALVLKSGEFISPDDLPLGIRSGSDSRSGGLVNNGETEMERLMSALRRNNGNHREAAAELGISRTTLWRRLQQLRIPGRPDGFSSFQDPKTAL
jgi:DNA-binding NtrC family response regulator